jgi:hypothetical protein
MGRKKFPSVEQKQIRGRLYQSIVTPRDILTTRVTWTRRQAARVTDRSRMFGGAERGSSWRVFLAREPKSHRAFFSIDPGKVR